MRLSAAIITLAAVALTAGCSTVSVETDFDRAADFTKYRTYRWIPHMKDTEDNPLMNDPLIKSHVQTSVDAVMAKRGLTRTDEGDPDFLVAYYFTTRNRMDVTHYYGYWHPRTNVYRYKEGTLILDIVDPEQKQLVWRGWASGVLESRENLHDQIAYSVEKLLERYPPRR